MNYIFEMPDSMLAPASSKGKVERFYYDTQTYDTPESTPLKKGAYIYLPAGYTPEKKYNVLYLLHGGGVNEDWWFVTFPDTVTILDNMMAQGICEPCLIVTPTYYRGEGLDGNAEYVTENFLHELRKDLIPYVESHYSTYAAGNITEENLIATRKHRAIAGLSLGSMTTYRAGFYNNFDLFSWYGPFSGCGGPWGNHDTEATRIQVTLADGEKKGLVLDYMFCCNGDQDIAYAEHTDIMTKALALCPQLVTGKNYDFFTIPGGVHDMKAWQLHLYHALQVFFK